MIKIEVKQPDTLSDQPKCEFEKDEYADTAAIVDNHTLRPFPNVTTFFDNPTSFLDYKTCVYPKVEDCHDEDSYLKLFRQMDRRIERLAVLRMQPYFKKEITGRNRCIVGVCDLTEWEEYVRRKTALVQPSVFRRLKVKLPSFDDTFRLVKTTYKVEWNDGVIPPLSHKLVWWWFKWRDPDCEVVFRSFMKTFILSYNSFLDTVSIEFEYRTHFYDPESRIWRTI